MTSLPDTWTRAGRNAARAVVRAAPGFDSWIARTPGIDRNSLTKDAIIAAAKALNVHDAVVAAVLAEMVASGHYSDDEDLANVVLDTAIEAKLAAAGGEVIDAAAIDAAVATVLDPIRQYLAPGLVDGLADRIRPIAVEAAKPARIVETIREVPAQPVAPPGTAPFAKVAGQSTMAKVFGVRGAQASLPVALWDAVDAPLPDPAYQVDPSTMGQVVTALEHGEVVWLAGSMGTGKGALAREFAARTRRSFVRIGFSRSTEITDLRGQLVPVPGETHGANMVWRDSVFTAAIRRPGTVILLDELMISPPGTVAVFQTILDEKCDTLPTGEVVHFAAGVVVIIADNSAGYGDETGAYAGVQPANAALVDRCGRLVVVDYLPTKLEASALHHKTGLPFPAAQRLADFAKVVRVAAAKAGGESRSFSYRRLIAFAVATFRDRLSCEDAWNVVALTRLPEADRATLRAAIAAHFMSDAYVAEMNGEMVDTTPSTPVSQAAEQVGARDVFARS